MNILLAILAVLLVQALISNTLILRSRASFNSFSPGRLWKFLGRTVWGVLISAAMIPGSSLGLIPVIGFKRAWADLLRFPGEVKDRVWPPKFF